MRAIWSSLPGDRRGGPICDEIERGRDRGLGDCRIDLASPGALTDAELRERMSGNLCRCSAYPNILAAVREVATAAGVAE